jgi:molybdopterin-synthase adenylyltransferase
MDDQSLLRYSRHILLNEIGVEGQEAIARARVLVVGAGGLGASALMYLASAGVGTITLADGDTVDLTNLQRQIIHRESSVGVSKAESAASAMRAINSTISIVPLASRLDADALDALVRDHDVVLDCSDNFATRHAINRAVVAHRKVLVSGAAIRFDGQLAVFDQRDEDAPCYSCLFPEDAEAEEERCAVMGVFAPLTGIIGTMQAAEALRIIVGIGDENADRKRASLKMLDARTMHWREVRFRKDASCVVCGKASSSGASHAIHSKESIEVGHV